MTYPHEDEGSDHALLAKLPREKEANPADPLNLTWLSSATCKRQRRQLFLASAAASITTILIMLGVFYGVEQYNKSRPLLWEAAASNRRPGTASCGTSTPQARSRGCFFDQLSMSWIPAKCTNAYNDEYMVSNNSHPYLYWFDEEGQRPLDDPSLHVGNDSKFWTTARNHLVHCKYNMFRLADALKYGYYVGHDARQTLSGHMHHCVETLTEYALKAPREELDVIDVHVGAGYGYC